MTGIEPFVIWVAGLGFRQAEDCTRVHAKDGYTDSVERHVIACTDEPYLSGKEPDGLLTVAQSVTSAAQLAMPPRITRHRSEHANGSSPVSGWGARSPVSTVTGRACGDACLSPPAPIPLPPGWWILSSALAGLAFWGAVIRWALS